MIHFLLKTQLIYLKTDCCACSNLFSFAIVIDLYAGTHPAGFAAIIRQ